MSYYYLISTAWLASYECSNLTRRTYCDAVMYVKGIEPFKVRLCGARNYHRTDIRYSLHKPRVSHISIKEVSATSTRGEVSQCPKAQGYYAFIYKDEHTPTRAVVVAQLVEQWSPTSEIRDTDPVIGKNYLLSAVLKLYWKDENKEKRQRMAHFLKNIPLPPRIPFWRNHVIVLI